MSEDREGRAMDELGSRFRSHLKLSEKERGCLSIERKDMEGALLGFQYSMVAEVLTTKEVKGDVFIDCFTSLWRGREGVSIRDIGDRRFLARFAGLRDLQRVLDADQPWSYKNDLVMVADRTEKGLNRWTLLTLGVFWVQMHNVPVLSMTQAVAESIGGLIGTVRMVDKTGRRDCIGRFLRVKVRFNVREPLMRGTFVSFPDDGRIWVEFKYEAFPNYCLLCGMLGHPTRVCKELQTTELSEDEISKRTEEGLAFRGLDAVTDLRGNPLGAGTRSRASQGSGGGRRNSGWKEEYCDEPDGGRRSGRSSTASGVGSYTRPGDSKSLCESESTAKVEDEVIDTATSPSKPRWSSSKSGKEDKELDEKIRCQRREDEEARTARELAFDAGLIGPGGVVATGIANVVLFDMQEQEASLNTASGLSGADQGIDLNALPIAAEGDECEQSHRETDQVCGNASSKEDQGIGDDPFDLEPIIEAVMKEHKRKKRAHQEVEITELDLCEEPVHTKPRRSAAIEAEETSLDNLLEQNQLHTPDIVILLETKNNSSRYDYLRKRLGLEYLHAVEPKGIG
ncbi:hypothetical protein ACFX11_044340 [Malus domestica]